MQFWYSAPANSDTSLKICTEKNHSINCLWNTPSSTTDEWKFGQIEIPANFDGNVSININELLQQ